MGTPGGEIVYFAGWITLRVFACVHVCVHRGSRSLHKHIL